MRQALMRLRLWWRGALVVCPQGRDPILLRPSEQLTVALGCPCCGAVHLEADLYWSGERWLQLDLRKPAPVILHQTSCETLLDNAAAPCYDSIDSDTRKEHAGC